MAVAGAELATDMELDDLVVPSQELLCGGPEAPLLAMAGSELLPPSMPEWLPETAEQGEQPGVARRACESLAPGDQTANLTPQRRSSSETRTSEAPGSRARESKPCGFQASPEVTQRFRVRHADLVDSGLWVTLDDGLGLCEAFLEIGLLLELFGGVAPPSWPQKALGLQGSFQLRWDPELEGGEPGHRGGLRALSFSAALAPEAQGMPHDLTDVDDKAPILL